MKFAFEQQWNIGSALVLAATFDQVNVEPVLPTSRNDHILSATDPLLRKQRFAVWQLLKKALATRGLDANNLQFAREPSGKWVCLQPDVCFSLSHSANAVAVAVDKLPVGVDVQCADALRTDSRLACRILNEVERARFAELNEETQQQFLAERWALKESVFKLEGGAFVPSRIDVTNAKTFADTFCADGMRFVVAAALSR